MLILSRRAAECIHLGDNIVLSIISIGNDKVRIGVKAPPGVKILRQELEATLATIQLHSPSEESSVSNEAQPPRERRAA